MLIMTVMIFTINYNHDFKTQGKRIRHETNISVLDVDVDDKQ